jgi:hypothetical protein
MYYVQLVLLLSTTSIMYRVLILCTLAFLRSVPRLLVTTNVPSSPNFVTLWCRQCVVPKRRFIEESHGVTSHSQYNDSLKKAILDFLELRWSKSGQIVQPLADHTDWKSPDKTNYQKYIWHGFLHYIGPRRAQKMSSSGMLRRVAPATTNFRRNLWPTSAR